MTSYVHKVQGRTNGCTRVLQYTHHSASGGIIRKKYFAYLQILLFIRMFAKHRYLFLPFNLPYLSCSLVIGVFSEVLDVDVGVAKLGLLQTGVDVSFPIGSSGLFRNCDGEKGKFLIGVPVGVTGSFLTSVGV